MDSERSDTARLGIRFLAACPRSGSTLIMRAFTESPHCAATSRLVFMGNHGKTPTFTPDYSILENRTAHSIYHKAVANGKSFIVDKEELGSDSRKGECGYEIIAKPEYYNIVRPAFILRDPVRTFDSWKHVGWTDMSSFFQCYKKILEIMGTSPMTHCIVYERLIVNPRSEVQRLCAWWGIPFDNELLVFDKPFGSLLFNAEREEK
jgi:hypothetical protein